mmetsp:Transcript_2683/g.9497  ORF Transcript_2683/g.9497 Transcript_2683/m.9497 type:complete len:1111 (+) Transcript_2683:108-3440(+)
MSASPLNKHLKKALLQEDGGGGGGGGGSQRRGLTRRGSFMMALKLKPEPEMKKSRRRTFSALQGRHYEGAAIYEDTYAREKQLTSTVDRERAVFVDGAGKAYNLLYEEVSAAKEEAGLGAAALQEFPSPDNFQDFTDFNQAVSQWYSRAQAAVGDLQLPDVLSRAYRRPRIGISLHDQEGETSTEGSATPGSTDDGVSLKQSVGEADEDLLFDKGWALDTDPWGSVLLPPEPQPSAYATFEEYEQALQNWACLCSCSLPMLPPHPAQLESIILLQTAETRQKNEKLRARKAMLASLNAKDQMFVLEREECQPIVGVRWLPEREGDVEVKKPPMLMPTFESAELERSFDATEATVEQCRGLFHGLAKERYRALKQSGRFQAHLTSAAHFIKPQEPYLTTSAAPLVAEPPEVSAEWPLWRSFPQTPDDGGERTILYIPFHRLNHLKRKRLTEPAYLRACQELVAEMQCAQRYDRHYCWYGQPRARPASRTADLLNKDKISPEDLAQAVAGPEMVDEFHRMLHSLDATCMQQLVDSLSASLVPASYSEYLAIADLVKDELALCKLNLVLALCLPSIVDSVMRPMLDNKDNLSLFRLAKAVTHFSAITQEIYPYNPTTILVVAKIAPSVVDVVEQNLSLYYVQAMASFLKANPSTYAALQPGVKRMLAKAQQSLQKDFCHVGQYFKLINHRSISISHLFLVLVLNLINFDSSSPIGEMVASCGIAERLQELALSRFTHVRKTALTAVLDAMATTLLRNVFTAHYSGNVEKFVEEVARDDSWSATLLNLAVEDLRTVQVVAKAEASALAKYKHVVQTGRDKTAFHVLWRRLKADVKCEGRNCVEVARFLVVAVATAAKLSMVCGLDKLEQATNKGSLQFHSSDLLELMAFIADRSAPVSHKGYLVRSNLLKAVSTITFNLQEPLEGALKSAQFFQSLIVSMKDGSDRVFNRLAWTYFYTLVKCKNDVVASMESKGMLAVIFELISPTTNPIVLAHCLQQLAEILTLIKKETKLVQRKEPTSRGEPDLRTLERDIKVLCVILVKHVVKVHFIYKRIKHDNTSGYVYSSLVRFYGAVARVKNLTNIGGSKVYKEFTKNKEYLANMNAALSAFKVTVK